MEDVKKELFDIHMRLYDTHQTFLRQMSALDEDIGSLHKEILSIAINNPENKEILEFIVFINDRLETRHTQFEDILKEVIIDMLTTKKDDINIHNKIVKHMEELEPKPNIFKKLLSKVNTLSDVKTLLGIGFALVLIYSQFYGGQEHVGFFKELVTLFLGK